MQSKASQTSQPNDYSDKIWTVPNILSLFRLVLIPFLVIAYFVEKNGIATAILFGVSALSDIADGFIARHFNMISNFGKALDPVADKLTQGVVLLCLVARHHIVLAVVAVLLVKEVVTGAVNLHIAKKLGIVNGAKWHGKLTTVVLFAMIFLHLAWYDITSTVSYISVAVCIAIMVMSFILYGIGNLKILRTAKKENSSQ